MQERVRFGDKKIRQVHLHNAHMQNMVGQAVQRVPSPCGSSCLACDAKIGGGNIKMRRNRKNSSRGARGKMLSLAWPSLVVVVARLSFSRERRPHRASHNCYRVSPNNNNTFPPRP